MSKKAVVKKIDLSESVHNKIGYTKKFSEDLVEEMLSIIKNKLKKGKSVKIYGFGKFVLRDKKARKGRDPQTGEPILISARRVLKFHSSKSLRKVFEK